MRVAFYSIFVHCLGDSTQLQTLIDGNISNSAPCVGQNITFVCNVQSFAHSWSSSGFLLPAVIIKTQQSIELRNVWPGYTLRVVTSDDVSITSSLSVEVVTTQTTLNNTVISCTDGIIVNGATQDIMATVLGELETSLYVYVRSSEVVVPKHALSSHSDNALVSLRKEPLYKGQPNLSLVECISLNLTT